VEIDVPAQPRIHSKVRPLISCFAPSNFNVYWLYYWSAYACERFMCSTRYL